MSEVKTAASNVPALRRAVAIMDYISSGAGEPTLSGIIRALALPKSTAYGLVDAMVELGLLTRAVDGSLLTGPHSLQWAGDFQSQSSLVTVFSRYFSGHHSLDGCTVTMSVFDGPDVVYVACANTNQPLGVSFRIGMRLPAIFTATGKAMLASLSFSDVQARLGTRFPDPLTRHGVRSFDAFYKEREETAARGFSIDDGQVREGMICLGTALFDYSGKVIAGLAISLTRSEATKIGIEQSGRKLVIAGEDISRQLGAR